MTELKSVLEHARRVCQVAVSSANLFALEPRLDGELYFSEGKVMMMIVKNNEPTKPYKD